MLPRASAEQLFSAGAGIPNIYYAMAAASTQRNVCFVPVLELISTVLFLSLTKHHGGALK